MNSTHNTVGGTAIYEPTSEEFAAYLEKLSQDAVGMPVAEFEKSYEAGEFDESDPAVSDLAALVRIAHSRG
jgi:hypothetical protein